MNETIEHNATAPTVKRDMPTPSPEQPRPVKLLDQVSERIRDVLDTDVYLGGGE